MCGRCMADHRASAGLRTPRPPRFPASSRGEVELAFREGWVSVYYRGNSLAVVVFLPAVKYRFEIHERFLDGLDPETRAEFALSRSYGQVTLDARGAHRILRRRNVGRLMKAIRDIARSEELTFEQIRDEAAGAYALPREDLRAEAPPRADRRRGHAGRDRDRRQRGRGARRGRAGARRRPWRRRKLVGE